MAMMKASASFPPWDGRPCATGHSSNLLCLALLINHNDIQHHS